ncbi:MAG: disulfide bond formation protein DsbB [uncultured bacterium]|nr:MAG: disulfide bond formation protein DsbB [uncultured bacterium]
MYPLVIILATGIIRQDKNVAYYVLPLSILGAIVALYQYLLQMTLLSQVAPATCSAVGSCSQIQVIYLGFITIPFLSLIAFLVISAMMIISLRGLKK